MAATLVWSAHDDLYVASAAYEFYGIAGLPPVPLVIRYLTAPARRPIEWTSL